MFAFAVCSNLFSCARPFAHHGTPPQNLLIGTSSGAFHVKILLSSFSQSRLRPGFSFRSGGLWALGTGCMPKGGWRIKMA